MNTFIITALVTYFKTFFTISLDLQGLKSDNPHKQRVCGQKILETFPLLSQKGFKNFELDRSDFEFVTRGRRHVRHTKKELPHFGCGSSLVFS